MDTRRLILVFVFSFSLVMLWEAWQKHNNPQAPLATAPAATATAPVPETSAPAPVSAASVPEGNSTAGSAKAEIVKVTDYGEIAAHGVMSTPGLAFDDQVVSTGRVLTAEEIAGLLRARN